MTLVQVWVVGGGGLLGSHLLGVLPTEIPGAILWRPGPSGIPWDQPEGAQKSLSELTRAFADQVRRAKHPWMVLWCAGSGVVGSRREELALETTYLSHLLDRLGAALQGVPGKVLLASSAGGVYGGTLDRPLTETTPCIPVSDYGWNKLEQERRLRAWALGQPLVSTLIARISNLYGPGQNMSKPQGLIAHLSRSLLHNIPVHIYVPLDTQRDYVFVEDCARQLVRGLVRLRTEPREDVVKIFHSGEVTTVAGVIAAFARIAKGHPRFISAASPSATQQPLHLPFRSLVWTDLQEGGRTSLPVGIQRVHQHLLGLFQQGRLPRLPLGH